MPEDQTLAIMTAISGLRDHLDAKSEALHTRISEVRNDIHAIDKRLSALENQPSGNGGGWSAAIAEFAAANPKLFLGIVLSLVTGYPIFERIDLLLQSLHGTP